MTLSTLTKSPYPWYGGKSKAAPVVWQALGDVAHYAEPFFGGGAALLMRPHPANRPYYSETINDLDGFVCNFWRAVTWAPQEVAEHASWPVSESDLHARHIAIVKWMAAGNAERLAGSWDYYDPVIAGWWVWGLACWIGAEFAAGKGAWVRDGDSGKLVKRPKSGVGVSRQRPHLSDDGQGVNAQTAREPGVSRKLPHLSDDGRGVNAQTAREPGVSRKRPHLSDNGRGVNAQTAREPGVGRDWREYVEDDYAATSGFHPLTMPEIRRWMDWLSARMRHVRVLNGDWKRISTSGALKTLPVRQGKGTCGIFLDPPYAHAERDAGLYRVDQNVASEVRDWCLKNGDDPDYRIVLAGFAGEGHEVLERHGWRVVEWFKSGYLTGGMGNQSENGHQQERERLWLSPHCIGNAANEQMELFNATRHRTRTPPARGIDPPGD